MKTEHLTIRTSIEVTDRNGPTPERRHDDAVNKAIDNLGKNDLLSITSTISPGSEDRDVAYVTFLTFRSRN